jgi:hypothetical protein
MLKALIVWVMLLAVPLQGFASATMLLCAPLPVSAEHEHPDVEVETADGHSEMETDSTSRHTHAANVASARHAHSPANADHHANSKCGSCASCCSGAAMSPSFASALPVLAPQFEVIPFASGHVPTVDLALPERPPRA